MYGNKKYKFVKDIIVKFVLSITSNICWMWEKNNLIYFQTSTITRKLLIQPRVS